MNCYLSEDFVLFHYNFQLIWIILYIRTAEVSYTEQNFLQTLTEPDSLPPFPLHWNFTPEDFFIKLQNLLAEQIFSPHKNTLLSAAHLSLPDQYLTASQIWIYKKIKHILNLLKQNSSINQEDFAKSGWNLRKIFNTLSQISLPFLNAEQQEITINIIHQYYQYKLTAGPENNMTSENLTSLNKAVVRLLSLFPDSEKKKQLAYFLNQNSSFLEVSHSPVSSLMIISRSLANFLLFLES